MKNYTAHFLLAFAVMLPCTGALAANLTPSAVLYSANQYNQQEISVTGFITKFKLNTTPDGKPYETFKICDGGACLDVYALGADARTEGAQEIGRAHV